MLPCFLFHILSFPQVVENTVENLKTLLLPQIFIVEIFFVFQQRFLLFPF